MLIALGLCAEEKGSFCFDLSRWCLFTGSSIRYAYENIFVAFAKLGHLWICGEKDEYGLVVKIIQKAPEKDISVADFIRNYLQKLKIPGYSTFHL